jgi:hypothetical protein
MMAATRPEDLLSAVMYSTCLFCHSNLGANEVVEHFPIGRRLVFDSARGRLWVVCRKCERWNLSPIEERWEAIEECEREFSNTRLRVSTENIGLARVREGLELVRVGSPMRPEMAAWRYGDQFGRRRRKHLITINALGLAGLGLIVLGPATGIIAGSSWGLFNVAQQLHSVYNQRRARARLSVPGFDEPVALRLKQISNVAIVDTENGWGLRVPFLAPRKDDPVAVASRRARFARNATEFSVEITGDDALIAAGKILPALNEAGANRRQVDDAVKIISGTADPHKLFAEYSGPPRYIGSGVVQPQTRILGSLPNEVRLALEMASHEDSERRALEGELAVLEEAWRQAEEIAAISDDMFVSDETKKRLSELKGTTD